MFEPATSETTASSRANGLAIVRWLLVSVPREPIWRILNLARGRYAGALGNTPGHLQHWSSRAFQRFVGMQADVRAVRRPLPWTIVLAEKRAGGDPATRST